VTIIGTAPAGPQYLLALQLLTDAQKQLPPLPANNLTPEDALDIVQLSPTAEAAIVF
jgi:hypothetical protein